MFKRIRTLVKNEEGQALAEYGLILALIAVICLAALTQLGTGVSAALQSIANAVTAAV